jgi:hypothetical protein
MDNCVLRVEKLANGYEVSIADPKIMAENEKEKKEYHYKSPWVEYAFTSAPEVVEFVKQHLESLRPEKGGAALYGQDFAEAAMKAEEHAGL